MNTFTKFAALSVLGLIYGCAPSGGEQAASSNSAAPVNTSADTPEAEVASTQELVASEDFDFKSDRTIALSFEKFPSDYGKFVIYSQYERYDAQLNTYYPDYNTRLASFVATPDLSYEIVIPSAQQFLVLEWLPMDGNSNESYRLLALNDQTSYAAGF